MKCRKTEGIQKVSDRTGAVGRTWKYPAIHSNKITIHGAKKCFEFLRHSETWDSRHSAEEAKQING